MKYNLKEYIQSRYYGMNDTVSPLALRGFEASSIENWLVRFQGKLKRRMGQTESGTDAGTTGVNSLTHWKSGSTVVQIKVIDKTIKSLSAGTWSNHGAAPTFTSAGDVNFCFANGYLYAFNGTDSPKKIGQTTSADVAAIPAGSWAVWYRNYLFVGGVAAYPNRIYFSNLGDPETYTADDYIDIEPGDGDELTGAIVSGPDKIFITKNYTVHYLTGSGPSTFAVYPLVRDFGIVSYRSLVNVGGDIWGITPDGRIMSLLKNQYGLYSGQDMASGHLHTALSGLNQQVLNKACGAVIDGYVIFAVANGAATTNDLMLVYDLDAEIPEGYSRWVKFTGWDINCLDVVSLETEEELFMGNSSNDKVLKWAGNTDDGTVITATWIGAEHEFESVGSIKSHKQIKINGFPLGDFNVAVYSSIDNGSYTDLGDFNLSNTGGTWNTSVWNSFLWGSVGIISDRFHFSDNDGKVIGYKCQLKFVYNANSDEPTLGTFSIYYSPMRWR